MMIGINGTLAIIAVFLGYKFWVHNQNGDGTEFSGDIRDANII